MTFKKKLVALAVFSASSALYAASFNCEKASTLIEKSICSNSELSSLDDQVGAVYKAAIQSDSVDVAAIKQEQKGWLKMRNACMDVACLKNAYQYRLFSLSKNIVSSGSQPDLANPLLVLDGSPDSKTPKDVKVKNVELTGVIGAFHDPAGGSYGLIVGKKSYTIRYMGFITDEQSDFFQKLVDSHRKVTVKGVLITYKDGSFTFDDSNKVVIY